MKTSLSNQCRDLLSITTRALTVALCLFVYNSYSAPRSPIPPVPEQAPIYHESFDEDYFLGDTNADIAIPGFGLFDQSWSGYALSRSGETVIPYVIPALDSTGYTNIACGAAHSAYRFWITPMWSSQSQSGGTGPGTNAVLLELNAVSGEEAALAWALVVGPDGNTLDLVAQTDSAIEPLLETPISWESETAHCVILDCDSANGTVLFVDGALAAQGNAVPAVPASLGQLVLGSRLSGTNAAEADIDEFSAFDRLLAPSDVAGYMTIVGSSAALGPMTRSTESEDESIRTPGNVYDPGYQTSCSTGGQPYITNVVATTQANGLQTVTFEICGTNGVFYDIFSTPNLLNTMASNQWNWIGEGLACNTYTFSNQPAGAAFYLLELPAETFTIAFDGGNSYGQLNVPLDLSNAVAVSAGAYFNIALRNNGTVIGWGDNTYNQTNIPAGLTNVVGIAAGYYHGVAVLANGSVTNWGYYWDGTTYYASVTNRTYSSAPPTSGVIAVAAGMGQDVALMSNGTVVAWGFDNVYGTGAAYGTQVPAALHLTNVSAIACGWQFNLALSSNNTITAWGYNDPLFGYPTNVPSDLTTNAVAIAAGGGNGVALRKNGTVEGWGDPNSGVTNVPTGLSNFVAVATGGESCLALQENGNIAIWGESSLTNIPAGIAGVKAMSSGFDHNIVVESGILTPIIFTQPVSQMAPAGSNVTFTALGVGVAGVTYQWQSNGVNLVGQTGSSLTLTNVSAANQVNYDVVITDDGAPITSDPASFTLVVVPGVASTTPTNTGLTWINSPEFLSAYVTNVAQSSTYPIQYYWQFNGGNVTNDTSDSYSVFDSSSTNEGTYSLGISNIVGGTNLSWNIRLAFPGMVEAWGADGSGQCSNRPVSLTNVTAIAAGTYQSLAVSNNGTIYQWGQYSDGTSLYNVTDTTHATQPPTNGTIAVAAGLGQGLALTTSNNIIAWGLTSSSAATVPVGVTTNNVAAVACGWQFDMALYSNGTVQAWGVNTSGDTTVPSNLSNVTAIAAGEYHALALSNGTVIAWGNNSSGQCTVPSTLSNVVAITAGDLFSVALQSNGMVFVWGDNTYGQKNVPTGLSNVMAIVAGSGHCVALQNNGNLVTWGANGNGQSTVPGEFPTIVSQYGGNPPIPDYVTNPPIVIKLIAAGGNHTMAGIWSPLVEYPINPTQDLLLVYNATNTSGSSGVWSYYLSHRPMVSSANSIGLSLPITESITNGYYESVFSGPISNWLSIHPTKRPQYVVLFQDLPSELFNGSSETSVQYDMESGGNMYLGVTNYPPSWTPFVTAINMNGAGGSNDCIQYINKLAYFGNTYSPGKVVISVPKSTYGNANYYFDDSNFIDSSPPLPGSNAVTGVLSVNPTASITYTNVSTNDTGLFDHLTNGFKVAGYLCWGWHSTLGYYYATNREVNWGTNSGWWIIRTAESFNGDRSIGSGFLSWFDANAFGSTNSYTNTPVGGVSYVNEPDSDGTLDQTYFGLWEGGFNFAICAFNSRNPGLPGYHYTQAVGDPFVCK